MEEASPLFRIEGSQGVQRLLGELDLSSAPLLVESLEGHQGDLMLDCSGLSFIDAAGLRAIVDLARRVRPATVALVRPSRQVVRLLGLLRAHEPLPLGLRLLG